MEDQIEKPEQVEKEQSKVQPKLLFPKKNKGHVYTQTDPLVLEDQEGKITVGYARHYNVAHDGHNPGDIYFVDLGGSIVKCVAKFIGIDVLYKKFKSK